MTPSVPLDLLVIGPHPDDAELSCGGWLALAGRRGQRAGILDLTRGELATNGTPEIRAEEAADAARILAVRRDGLGLPDGGLRPDEPDQVAALVEALRARRPRLLVAPWIDDRHPDHGAAGRLAERATFLAGLVRYRPDLGAPHRPARLIHYPQRREVRPSFVVPIDEVVDVKWAAIRAHRSQVGGGESTLVNTPLGLAAFEVRDRYWGATVGVSHGEPYLLGGPVPMPDPVAHLAPAPDGRGGPPMPVLEPPR